MPWGAKNNNFEFDDSNMTSKPRQELKVYLLFLVEEIPSILTIIAVPTLIGFLIVFFWVRITLALLTGMLLLVYLWRKSLSFLKVSDIEPRWFIFLILTFLLSTVVEVVIVTTLLTSVKISLKY